MDQETIITDMHGRDIHVVDAPDIGRELTADETLALFDEPRVPTCSYCGQRGHVAASCRLLKRHMEKEAARILWAATVASRVKLIVERRRSIVVPRPNGSRFTCTMTK